MIEYLYDAIRATSGQEIPVVARITSEDGILVTSGCSLILRDNEAKITEIDGTFDGEQWTFIIPADATADKYGRHWYCIRHNNVDLCFYQPIYLI